MKSVPRLAQLLIVSLTHVFSPASVAAPGDLDPTFGTAGVVRATFGDSDSTGAVVRQADGRYLVTGGSPLANVCRVAVSRFLPDGAPDASFGSGGVVFAGCSQQFAGAGGRGLALLPDGRFLVLVDEQLGSRETRILRRLPNGAADVSFGTAGAVIVTGPQGEPVTGTSFAVDVDGSIVLALFSSGAQNISWIHRRRADGTSDTSFGSNGFVRVTVPGFPNDVSVLAVHLAPDRLIVATGGGYAFPSSGRLFALRLLPDGTPDANFGIAGLALGPSANDYILGDDIAFQADGGIVVSGWEGSGGYPTRPLVARFTPGGVPDVSFDGDGALFPTLAGDSGSTLARSVQIDAQDGIVVAGSLSSGRVFVLRLLPNGSRDTAFNADGQVDFTFAGSPSDAGSLIAQPDGKYVVGGASFDRGGGNASLALARLEGPAGVTPPPAAAAPALPVPATGAMTQILLVVATWLVAACVRQQRHGQRPAR